MRTRDARFRVPGGMRPYPNIRRHGPPHQPGSMPQNHYRQMHSYRKITCLELDNFETFSIKSANDVCRSRLLALLASRWRGEACGPAHGTQFTGRLGPGIQAARGKTGPTMSLTCFVVLVPESEDLVGAIRSRFDDSARRGLGAHITVLYPFMPPEQLDAAILEQAAASIAAHESFAF